MIDLLGDDGSGDNNGGSGGNSNNNGGGSGGGSLVLLSTDQQTEETEDHSGVVIGTSIAILGTAAAVFAARKCMKKEVNDNFERAI